MAAIPEVPLAAVKVISEVEFGVKYSQIAPSSWFKLTPDTDDPKYPITCGLEAADVWCTPLAAKLNIEQVKIAIEKKRVIAAPKSKQAGLFELICLCLIVDNNITDQLFTRINAI